MRLTDGAEAKFIAVSGNDVYMAGTVFTGGGLFAAPAKQSGVYCKKSNPGQPFQW